MDCITEKILTDLSENDVVLNPADITFLESYLQDKLKTGYNNMKVIRGILFMFFRFVKTTTIKEITRNMILDYFHHLNTTVSSKGTPFTYGVKHNRRGIIAAFFRYYSELMEGIDPAYRNPMPRKTLKIDKPMKSPQQEAREITESVFTVDQILLILRRSREMGMGSVHITCKAYFPIYALMTLCGMRISECLSIRLENLHLNERYLITGLEENARKNKRPLICCFPQELIVILQEYLFERNQYYQNSVWLFPTNRKKTDEWFSIYSAERFLKLLGRKENGGIAFHPHSFRRTLSTFRLNGMKPTPLHIEETLSNHAITSLVMRNYNRYTLEMRRRDYDLYFPVEYGPILQWLKSL